MNCINNIELKLSEITEEFKDKVIQSSVFIDVMFRNREMIIELDNYIYSNFRTDTINPFFKLLFKGTIYKTKRDEETFIYNYTFTSNNLDNLDRGYVMLLRSFDKLEEYILIHLENGDKYVVNSDKELKFVRNFKLYFDDYFEDPYSFSGLIKRLEFKEILDYTQVFRDLAYVLKFQYSESCETYIQLLDLFVNTLRESNRLSKRTNRIVMDKVMDYSLYDRGRKSILHLTSKKNLAQLDKEYLKHDDFITRVDKILLLIQSVETNKQINNVLKSIGKLIKHMTEIEIDILSIILRAKYNEYYSKSELVSIPLWILDEYLKPDLAYTNTYLPANLLELDDNIFPVKYPEDLVFKILIVYCEWGYIDKNIIHSNIVQYYVLADKKRIYRDIMLNSTSLKNRMQRAFKMQYNIRNDETEYSSQQILDITEFILDLYSLSTGNRILVFNNVSRILTNLYNSNLNSTLVVMDKLELLFNKYDAQSKSIFDTFVFQLENN